MNTAITFSTEEEYNEIKKVFNGYILDFSEAFLRRQSVVILHTTNLQYQIGMICEESKLLEIGFTILKIK